MKLVVDANILFSALLKDSGTRKLLLDRRLSLFAPKFLLLEYVKYSKGLRSRSKLREDDFASLSKMLLGRIRLISDEEIMLYYSAARSLVDDSKDAPYVACALAADADLWSNDRHLKGIRVKNWATKELMEKMQKSAPTTR